MPTEIEAANTSKTMLWTGRVMSAVVVLFLLMDSSMKLMRIAPVLEAQAQLGYPDADARLLGVIVLVCALLYAFPRTAILGAILTTGLLGGAIASHLRIESPLFSHTLFGVYLGLLAWGGLFFQDQRLRALIPWRR